MQDTHISVQTDQSIYGEDEELIVRCSGFKGMPNVDCILVVRVKDDSKKVMMFIKDHTCDSKSFIIENVVGLGLSWNVELVTWVEFGNQ